MAGWVHKGRRCSEELAPEGEDDGQQAREWRGREDRTVRTHRASTGGPRLAAVLAVKDFRMSARLDPLNLDAVREVRVFEMRTSRGSIPAPARPSGKRLFGG
jgi:hypothetical protein